MRFTGLLNTAVMAAVLLSLAGIQAQSGTGGTVFGRVIGPGGSPVPRAQIRLQDIATGQYLSAQSGVRGGYYLSLVMPGEYRLLVRSRGLSDWEADNLTIGVGTTTRLDPFLALRSLHRTELLDARRALDNAGSAANGTDLGPRWLQELPNNGQHYSNLAALFTAASPDANGGLSFRGLSPLMNGIAVDGTNNTLAFRARERGTAGNGYALGSSTVAGFRTSTVTFSPEYAHIGGMIHSVTRNGSSRLHGQVVFFDRGSIGQAWNAYSTIMQPEPAGTTKTSTGQPVQYLNGQPITYVETPARIPDRRQQWEISAGGPIRRNRAVWFLSWEQHDRHDPAIARAREPQVFFFPASQTALNTLEARLARNPVTNPLVHDCPVASGAMAGSTAAAACAYTAVLNQLGEMLGSVPRSTWQSNVFQKIDWHLSRRNQLLLQYSFMRRTAPHGALSGATESDAFGSFGNSSTSDDAAIAQWDFFMTPRLLSSMRVQISRDVLARRPGPPSPFERRFANNSYGLAPQITVDSTTGFTFGTLSNMNKTEYPAETRQQIVDSVTWFHGRQALRFGYDFNHVRDELNGLNGQNGAYSYASLVDFISDLLAPNSCNGSGSDVGTYPCYSRFRQTVGFSRWWFTTSDYAGWIANQWEVGRRLSLTAGLRYEYEHLPDTNSALVNPAVPETAKLPHNRNELSPRFGFSWNVLGRAGTVLRGGFGIYYARVPNALVFSALTATGTTRSPRTYSWRPTDEGAPPFPYVFSSSETPFSDPNAPDQATSAPDILYFDPRFQHPQIDEEELSLQQSLGPGSTLSVTAMATDGHHLAQFLDTNIDRSAVATMFYTVRGPDNLGDAGPLGTAVGQASGSSFPIYSLPQSFYYRRINPAYGSISDIGSETNSSYRGATVRLVRRMSSPFSINVGYTWSEAVDDNQSEAVFAPRNNVYDPAHPALEHGTSNFDVRQRVAGGMVVRSPWRLHGAEGLLLGGYTLSATGAWRTGLPYSMRAAGALPTPYCSYQNWLLAGGATGRGSDCLKAVQQPNETFDANTVPVPVPGLGASLNGSGGENRIQAIGRNTFRYPHAANLDVRFTKKVCLSDRFSFEVMGEAFNALNHLNVTRMQAVGYRVINDPRHANMANLNWQSGMRPGSAVELVNGTSVSEPLFDATAAFGSPASANSRSLMRERQLQMGLRLSF